VSFGVVIVDRFDVYDRALPYEVEEEAQESGDVTRGKKKC